MYQQPAAPGGRAWRQRLLFTPPVGLGGTSRSRRDLIAAYPEPPPDPEAIKQQAAARLAAATRSWQRARTWGVRPSLIIFVALVALAGCAHALNPASQAGPVIVTALVLAAPGLSWAGWRYAQFSAAKAADPGQQYQAAHSQWTSRVADHEQAELDRLAEGPQLGSAELRTLRTDVYGGTLAGWRSLLTVHGASILARQPLLVADLTGQYALAELAALARDARVPSAEWVLPRDLDRSGLLTRLSGHHLAEALAAAIHAGQAATARPSSPQPAYCALFATEPGARSARGELLAALVIQWLTVEVTASTATAPAVVIAGADEITRSHLARLADACDRRNVPL